MIPGSAYERLTSKPEALPGCPCQAAVARVPQLRSRRPAWAQVLDGGAYFLWAWKAA